jgi:hypothetical protein
LEVVVVLASISPVNFKFELMSDTTIPEDEQPVQDLVTVINRAGLIENLLNQIISDYCGPRKDSWVFMWNVVLDTSVMPLGSKLKVVMAVAQELKFKLPKDALNKVVQLRNSFAHHTTNAHPAVSIGRTPEEDSYYNQFYTLDGNGVLKSTKRHEAFETFNQSYQIAKQTLGELRNLVVEKYPRENPYVSPPAEKSYYDNNYVIDNRLRSRDS